MQGNTATGILIEPADPSACPTGPWHRGIDFEWTFPGVEYIQTSFLYCLLLF